MVYQLGSKYLRNNNDSQYKVTWYCCLVSCFGLLVSFQLVIGILQHFSIVLVSYKSLVFLLV